MAWGKGSSPLSINWEGKEISLAAYSAPVVSIMESRMPLSLTLLCVVLLCVLGEMKSKHDVPLSGDELLVEECSGEPNRVDCAQKCSRTFKCAQKNHMCCWTYCGNICWEREYLENL
ncbi:protein WFDC11-like [Urocitellus parryii]